MIFYLISNANLYKLITGNLNVNSVSNKSDKLMLHDKVDILVLTETKLEFTFLNQQL